MEFSNLKVSLYGSDPGNIKKENKCPNNHERVSTFSTCEIGCVSTKTNLDEEERRITKPEVLK
jgi:hypothetical protein